MLKVIIFGVVIYAIANLIAKLTAHKCKKVMILIDGENVTFTCTECGRSQTVPGKLFEEKFGKSAREYVETEGYYLSL